MPPSSKCGRCGYLHPPPTGDKCPVWLSRQAKEGMQVDRVRLICSQLEAKLSGMTDITVRDEVLTKLEKMIKVI